MANDKQKQLLAEVMNEDAKDGLYDHIGEPNKKMTAVDWLISQQKHNKFFNDEIIEQAKQMENEQIKNAYNIGKVEANFPPEMLTNGEKYYKETYGN